MDTARTGIDENRETNTLGKFDDIVGSTSKHTATKTARPRRTDDENATIRGSLFNEPLGDCLGRDVVHLDRGGCGKTGVEPVLGGP